MAKAQIYSSSSCGYCVAAKTLLKQRGFDYEEIRVDTDPAKLAEMLERSRARSIPQIFIDGRHIGGFEDLLAEDRAGRLVAKPSGDPA